MIYAGRTCLPYIRVPIMYRCQLNGKIGVYEGAASLPQPLSVRGHVPPNPIRIAFHRY